MKFTRLTDGEIKVGTRYRQKVLLPFAPSWEVEVTKLIPNREIERTFLNGMFSGKENVSIEKSSDRIKLDYLMLYRINGRANEFFWNRLFERMHDQNIRMILKALEQHLKNKNEVKR